MFETTSVPQGWVQMINDHLDEIWVPSKFQKAVFLKEGVKKPIVVIKVFVPVIDSLGLFQFTEKSKNIVLLLLNLGHQGSLNT